MDKELQKVFGHVSHVVYSCYCKESGIQTCWHTGFRLTFDPEFQFLLNVTEIADPDVDCADVKLYGCHTPLDYSKRTDLS